MGGSREYARYDIVPDQFEVRGLTEGAAVSGMDFDKTGSLFLKGQIIEDNTLTKEMQLDSDGNLYVKKLSIDTDYSPRDIPGLIFWLAGPDLSPSSGPFSTWTDRIAGKTYVPRTTPSPYQAPLNGFGAVQFDNNGDRLGYKTGYISTSPNLTVSAPWTCIVNGNNPSTTNNAIIMSSLLNPFGPEIGQNKLYFSAENIPDPETITSPDTFSPTGRAAWIAKNSSTIEFRGAGLLSIGSASFSSGNTTLNYGKIAPAQYGDTTALSCDLNLNEILIYNRILSDEEFDILMWHRYE